LPWSLTGQRADSHWYQALTRVLDEYVCMRQMQVVVVTSMLLD